MSEERRHIVICGPPRCGTTLLMLMLHETVTNFTVPRKEIPMKNVKYCFDRIITKCPADVLDITHEKMRDFNALRILLMIRDPRSILCSTHGYSHGQFKMGWDKRLITGFDGPRGWEAPGLKGFLEATDHVREQWNTPCISYEQFIKNPDSIRQYLGKQFSLKFSRSFSQAWENVVKKKGETLAKDMPGKLNGVRPVDPDRIQSWRKHPKHVLKMVKEHPEIKKWVKRLGYEKDDSWVQELKGAVGNG